MTHGLSLESMMAMAQAKEAQRRQQQAQQQQAQQAQQQAQRAQASGGAAGSGGCEGTGGAQSSPAPLDAAAASDRNSTAGQSWSSFQAQPTSPQAPAMPTAPATAPAEPRAPAQQATSATPPSGLQQTLAANPRIRTNQDLINHYYKQGGGTWEGASRLARADGASLNQLIRNRSGLVSAGETPPATTTPATPGTTPPATTTPSTPPATTTPGSTPPPSSTSANGVQTYRPGSPEQIALFTEAGRRMGLSDAEARRWATSPGLQNILSRESGGQVGRPNYTYGSRARDPSQWQSIHDELKAGRKTATSSATGLGQLLLSNVERYYPSGRAGIGNPMEEAIGMMRYIQDRYGSPERAWSQYGVRHEGY